MGGFVRGVWIGHIDNNPPDMNPSMKIMIRVMARHSVSEGFVS